MPVAGATIAKTIFTTLQDTNLGWKEELTP